MIECKLNDVPVQFELDSGASVSTIGKLDADRIGACIKPSFKKIIGYGGNDVPVEGETTVKFNYYNANFHHTFIVIKSNYINLLGRDICEKMKMKVIIPDKIKQLNYFSSTVLDKFKNYLSMDFQSCVKHEVKLNLKENAIPIFSKCRPVPIRLKNAVKQELDRLVDLGKITKVFESEWSSPIVAVLKDTGDVRICGDFSGTVNKYLQPVQSPLTSIDDVISQIGEAKYFSKVDLSQAYLQIPLNEESKSLTTINTSDGLYRYNYLPFGLSVSPGIFQGFISKVLNGISNLIIYQDDILVLTNTVDHHNEVLYLVLTALHNTGIKLNIEKSEFFVSSVSYLGHVFDNKGVHPSPDKIRAICNAPVPKNIKQLQAFIGICNFYSKFIPNFSNKMVPLYNLLKKGITFKWDSAQQKSFDYIKNCFKTNNVLNLFNPKYETMLETDSSGYGLGAVLCQRKNSNFDWHPVQFISRTLNTAEQNYSNIEREALSVVYACEKLSKFLLGCYFIIRNDHKPLKRIFKSDSGVPINVSARLQRWALRLSQFQYEFVYSKGSENIQSDCLSRLPLADTVSHTEPYELIFTLNTLDNMPITSDKIKECTDSDEDLKMLKSHIKYGWPVHEKNPRLSVYKRVFEKLSILRGCVLYESRVVIPMSLRADVLNLFHEGHPGIVGMKSLIRGVIWYPNIDSDIESLVKNCPSCQVNRAKPPQNNNITWPEPKRAWSRLHIDHFFFENKICLIVCDSFSKYIECEIVDSVSVDCTIDALRLIFSRNGISDIIVSDNATSFTASKFKDFLATNSIKHITSPPYSPSSNGQAERAVRVIKDLLKKCTSDEPFRTRLCRVLFYYRTTPHSVTSIAPCVSLNNRKYISIKDKINPKFNALAEYQNSKTISRFNIGDRVLALNLRNGPKWLQGTVVAVRGVNVFDIHINSLDIVWSRHSNQLLKLPPISNPVEKPISQKSSSNICSDSSSPNQGTSQEPSSLANVPNSNVCSSGPCSIEPGLRRSSRITKPVVRYGIND